MALLFCDGFDYYTLANITRKWTSTAGTGAAMGTGRYSGQSWTRGTGSQSSLTLGVTALTTAYVGFALKMPSIGTENRLLQFFEGSSSQCELFIRTDGKLECRNNGTTRGTGTTVLSAGVWYYIEVKVTIANSGGVFDIHLGGVSELSSGSIDTQTSANANFTSIIIGGSSTATAFQIDDFYLCDGTGSVNNTYLGDVRIKTLYPNAAGNYAEWTPLSSTNVSNVDETAADDDTTYNSSATANQRDTFGYDNTGLSSGTVKAVAVNMVAKKDDAGTHTVKSMARLSSTDALSGTALTVASSYSNLQGIHETDPATNAWTVSNVDSAEFGYKLIS